MGLHQGYDLIGDVHGCAQSLRLLLENLGYSEHSGVYRHRSRKAIFVGDLVDRGPRIRETVDLVHAMVNAGEAEIVMGNHEFNYLCYRTPSRLESDRFLRSHTPRNQRIVQETLDQYANHPADEEALLSWIREMKLFIEKPDLRVVHACWHFDLIEQLRETQSDQPLMDDEFFYRSSEGNGFEWLAMDRLLRGMHLKLPNNEVMVSKDGFKRHFFRTSFWLENPSTLGEVAFQPDPLPEHIAAMQLTEENRADLEFYGSSEKPLFIGHFWCEGDPEPVAPNIACLDYSAVKFGKLVAYRFDGEARLDPNKFVWIDVAKEFPRTGADS